MYMIMNMHVSYNFTINVNLFSNAYKKWCDFWNDYQTFIVHYQCSAEIESRQQKKFQSEFPLIEQEFLHILSEHNHPPFLLYNKPIRQLFDRAYHQLPSLNPPQRLTLIRSRIPIDTVN